MHIPCIITDVVFVFDLKDCNAIPSMTAGHRLRQRHFPGRLAQEASAHHEPGLGLHGLDLRHPRNRPGFLVVIGHRVLKF